MNGTHQRGVVTNDQGEDALYEQFAHQYVQQVYRTFQTSEDLGSLLICAQVSLAADPRIQELLGDMIKDSRVLLGAKIKKKLEQDWTSLTPSFQRFAHKLLADFAGETITLPVLAELPASRANSLLKMIQASKNGNWFVLYFLAYTQEEPAVQQEIKRRFASDNALCHQIITRAADMMETSNDLFFVDRATDVLNEIHSANKSRAIQRVIEELV